MRESAKSLRDVLRELQSTIIRVALDAAGGNVSAVARALRTDRRNLLRRMRWLGLRP